MNIMYAFGDMNTLWQFVKCSCFVFIYGLLSDVLTHVGIGSIKILAFTVNVISKIIFNVKYICCMPALCMAYNSYIYIRVSYLKYTLFYRWKYLLLVV